MISGICRNIGLIGLAIALFSFDAPDGWQKKGAASRYDMGIDKENVHDGRFAYTVKSLTTAPVDKFGTLLKGTETPHEFLGKRVRLSGYLKTENVHQWASFFLAVEGTEKLKSVAFDNMYNRPVKGTTGWQKYEIVLDVPAVSTGISYGAILAGEGQIWFDNISFEIVDKSVPVTDLKIKNSEQLPAQAVPARPAPKAILKNITVDQ